MKKILSVSLLAIGLMVASVGTANASGISINFGNYGYHKPAYYKTVPVYYGGFYNNYYAPKTYYKSKRKSYKKHSNYRNGYSNRGYYNNGYRNKGRSNRGYSNNRYGRSR